MICGFGVIMDKIIYRWNVHILHVIQVDVVVYTGTSIGVNIGYTYIDFVLLATVVTNGISIISPGTVVFTNNIFRVIDVNIYSQLWYTVLSIVS